MRLVTFISALAICYSFSAKELPTHPALLAFAGMLFAAMDFMQLLDEQDHR